MSSRHTVAYNWICSQIGAREHFAVPRALHQDGKLATLYTDFWAGAVVRNFSFGKLRPLAARFHSNFNDQSDLVRSWNFRSLAWEFLLRRKFGRNPYHGFIEVGQRFARRVREDLKRRTDLNPNSIFFAYDTGALETLAWCREQKIKCVLNQMDPNRVEVELVRAEEKQWPGWAAQPIQVPEEYFIRREQEWALADRVVVNSEFSRQALIGQGVSPEKLAIIPLCYEAKNEDGNNSSVTEDENGSFKTSAATPLRVLFLGQVILRKGIQYLLAAARQLECEPVHFDVVGPIGISPAAISLVPSNVTFHGRTGRDEAVAWYRRSHVFVLPTLSDGFAITQLEAMAHGLPVIATPNCGEVVRDGVDGFVVPPRDVEALVQAFRKYLANLELIKTQRTAALVKARQFTLPRLAENLARLETDLAR